MCITPLSIEIPFLSLELNAVTKAGQAKSELCSGNNEFGTLDLILLIIFHYFLFLQKKLEFYSCLQFF